jgi:hypothetical protein
MTQRKELPPVAQLVNCHASFRELARRGEAWGDSEIRQMLEHEIETGRGGCYLRLSPEQYARLTRF